MPPVWRVIYLLVLVDTFLGWVEAFPLQTKELTPWPKSSLQNLSPDLACLHPYSLIMAWNLHPRSPNNLSQFLPIPWKFHIPCSPQSSGKVERINRIIKETPTKLPLKVHLDWTKLLPIVILKVWALPRKPLWGDVWKAHAPS